MTLCYDIEKVVSLRVQEASHFAVFRNSLPLPAMTGPLEVNDRLSNTEHLFEGMLDGPESIVFHKDELYTGLADGRIVKIKDNRIMTVARTGRSCKMPYEEHLCGRPLGLRIGHDGLLYVADAYYGIFTMNFTTGVLSRVLASSALVEGRQLTFPDDLDLDDAGNIYFTDASAKWDLSNIYYLIAELENSGRVIRYNVHSGESEVILKDLSFPNGVQISHDANSLLVCEINNRRILRYRLKGPEKGKLEVFADTLPAEPDNIRPSSRGGYWVAFTAARNHSNPFLSDHLNPYPSLKRLWARAHHGLGTLLVALADITASSFLKEMAYKFKRGDVMIPLYRRHGLVIEFDNNGQILRSLHAPDGKTTYLSQVTEHDGYLYLGSFINDYLGRLKI